MEVAPKELINAKEALENLNQALISNRDQLGEQLQVEKAVREQLEAKLQSLESKILGETVVMGGHGPTGEDPMVVLARKKAEQRRLQQKVGGGERGEGRGEGGGGGPDGLWRWW